MKWLAKHYAIYVVSRIIPEDANKKVKLKGLVVTILMH